MKKYKVFVFLILLMLAAPVVLIAGGNSEKADEEKIIAVLDDYGKFLIAGDYESWGLLHSENVVKMPPDVFPTTTRQDMVLQSSKSGEFMDIVSFDVDMKELSIQKDYAYTWGTYNLGLVLKDGGQSVLVDGKYLTLFRKGKDGNWSITHDCFNSNVPPPAQ